MHRLATIAVGCIIQPQHSEKPNCQNFCIWNSFGHHGPMTTAIPDAAFSPVWFCSYTVLYSLSDGYASCLQLQMMHTVNQCKYYIYAVPFDLLLLFIW